jgi:hypothetical protein
VRRKIIFLPQEFSKTQKIEKNEWQTKRESDVFTTPATL